MKNKITGSGRRSHVTQAGLSTTSHRHVATRARRWNKRLSIAQGEKLTAVCVDLKNVVDVCFMSECVRESPDLPRFYLPTAVNTSVGCPNRAHSVTRLQVKMNLVVDGNYFPVLPGSVDGAPFI